MTSAIVRVEPARLTLNDGVTRTLAAYDEKFAGLEAVVSRQTFKVDSEAVAEWVNTCLHLIAEDLKVVEAARKTLVQPINEEVDAINGEFMPRVQRAKQLKEMLADALARYVQDQASTKAEAMRAAAQAHIAGDHQQAQLALQVANQAQASAPVGTSMKSVWKMEVTDASAVPREYCAPDEKLLKKLARETTTRPPEIPGVRFFRDTRTTVRSTK